MNRLISLFRSRGTSASLAIMLLPAMAGAQRSVPIDTTYHAPMSVRSTLAGAYRLATGHDILVGPFDEMGGRLVMLDLGTLQQRVLFEQDDSTYVAGPGLMDPSRAAITLRFRRARDGRTRDMLVARAGERARRALLITRMRSEEVTFRNAGVVLHGTLRLPDSPGPHPAVVLVHGSGPATRNVGPFQTFYDRLGVAVLSFDKRGAGQSSGDWSSAGFNQLAGDVVAAVRLLRARPDIDRASIGLSGSSQGGWVGTLAARAALDSIGPGAVSWLAVRVGSGVTVAENVLWERRSLLAAEGYPPAQVDSIIAFGRDVYALAATGASWERSDTLARAVSSTGWFRRLYPSGRGRDDALWTWYQRNAAVDAMPVLRTLPIAVDWTLGRYDDNVPTVVSAPLIGAALAGSPSADWSVRVLPSDHTFLGHGPGPGGRDIARGAFVAGYWDALETFMRRQTTRAPVVAP